MHDIVSQCKNISFKLMQIIIVLKELLTINYGVAIDPAVDGKRSRVGLGFGVGLGVLLG